MAYNKNDITAIILKNEHDACTPEEFAMLEQWYNSLDDKIQTDKFNSSDKAKKKDAIWAAVNLQIEGQEREAASLVEFKPGKTVFYYIARIAAMLVLVAGAYFIFNSGSTKNTSTGMNAIKYLSRVNNTNKPVKIILPDNSLLWLDVKTSIKYAEHFVTSRNISLLSGKVFFNVAHNAARPFIVETGNGLKTTVLGTAFVIEKNYTDSSVKVSVLRGKVQVADKANRYATLTKNQGVNVNTESKMANLLTVDSLAMTTWFTSKVVLDNVTLKEVAASIKETFGYKIEFVSAKLLSKPCSITYNATDNVDDILVLLDKIYHTSHTVADSIISIKPLKK